MSDKAQIVKMSAAQMAEELKKGEISSRELTEAHLSVIESCRT